MSPTSPDRNTRPSLVARLPDAGDHEIWAEFAAIYEPLLMRLLRGFGLQESDVRDVCQQVMQAVARNAEKWRPDGKPASFRRWLSRVARNQALKHLARERKRVAASGGTTARMALEARPDPRESLSDRFEREYREELMVRAAEQIRGEFRESTWEAFWRTCVQGRPIAEVARELELSTGSVYVARSRIVARLRSRVRAMLDEDQR